MSACRCSNPDYLVMTRKLLKDFERMSANKERESLRLFINDMAINWNKSDGVNPRKLLMDLSEAINQGEHLA